jgi:hypothetical protein
MARAGAGLACVEVTDQGFSGLLRGLMFGLETLISRA